MRGDLLPLFPLQAVLLPRAPLPLHVFEERYKEMLRDVMPAGSEFGVVLASDEGLLSTGCTAVVERILRQFEDGRLDLMAVGVRRFRILELDSERSYLRAQVEDFEDDDFSPVPQDKLSEALGLHAEYTRGSDDETETPGPDEPQLSFVLGAVSPDIEFRQLLLSMRSEARRIEFVATHLAQLILRRKVETAMKKTARTNGHGRPWKG